MNRRRPCPASVVWPDVAGGVRLTCCLPGGHDGDHLADVIEHLDLEPATPEMP